MSEKPFPIKELMPFIMIAVALSGAWAVGKQDVSNLKTTVAAHDKKLIKNDLEHVLYDKHGEDSKEKFKTVDTVEKQLARSVLIQELIAAELGITVPVRVD